MTNRDTRFRSIFNKLGLQLTSLSKLTDQLVLVISSSKGLHSAQITTMSKDVVLEEKVSVQSYSYGKSAETAVKMKWHGKVWVSASLKNSEGTDATI